MSLRPEGRQAFFVIFRYICIRLGEFESNFMKHLEI